MPLSLPGALHPSNKFCIDWNTSGIIAYGSHNTILIVDVSTCKRIQTIEHHSAAVENICWAPSSTYGEFGKNNSTLIASSDIGGHILITDAFSAVCKAQFVLAGTNVLAMTWYSSNMDSTNALLALHSGNTLVMWNTVKGEKIWSHTYTHNLLNMALDPFNNKELVFSSTGCSLVIVRDISMNKEPFNNGFFANLNETSSISNNVQYLTYHKAYKNSLLVLANNQLMLFDTELCVVLTQTQMESNLVSLNSCSLRDAIYSIQSNGSVTLRVGTYCSNDDRADARFDFEKIVSSETHRHSAQQKVVGTSLCPITESTLAVLYNSGKMVFWQLSSDGVPVQYMKSSIENFIIFDSTLSTKSVESLKLFQTGFIGSLNTTVGCVRMRPMDELGKTKEDSFASSEFGASHVAAVGTHAGTVHLVEVFNSKVLREFYVQSSPIRSLEWGGAYTILTAGYNHALSTTHIVRNDIYATDIRTGISRRIRPEYDESPVSLVRVSYYHCYLALAFQREPLEIWDLKTFRLLRKMSRTCPLIVDMAWSSKHHGMKMTESSCQSVYRENLVVLDSENRLYHVAVKGLHVKDGKEVNTQWKSGGWTIRSMAWKDDMLAMGDADGRIAVWDLGRKLSRHIRASRFPVLRMCFSRLAGDHSLAVLHQRELVIWDTEALVRIQEVSIESSRAALDMDLCGISPILLTNDNVFRFLPSSAKNNSIAEKDIPILMNSSAIEKIVNDFDIGQSDVPSVSWLLQKKTPRPLIDEDKIDLTSVTNESLLSRFIGDRFGYLLLEIVKFALDPSVKKEQLPPVLQLFWPNDVFKERELRVTCAACAASDAMESRIVERAVVTGGKAKERAVDRLIASPDLRHASMKAALLVSSQDSEQSRSLIKLIATNLIASDMIEDGVELLFLVGAGADACKYLQSQKHWAKSVVYAKMGLEDPKELIAKWVAYLQEEDVGCYILAQAARMEWPSVVEALTSIGRSRLAHIILRTATSSPPSTTASVSE
ncbi:unnamed protein product [Auanema sp. JU1783]|nr:unnamed protein product [Auanema sp. JU1783]